MFSNPLYFILPGFPSRSQEDTVPLRGEYSLGKEKKSLFDPVDALIGGNAFKDEYRGYKNYKPGLPSPTDDRERLMMEIMAYAMVAHDLGLYLDVYPKETELIKEFEKYSAEAQRKTDEYVKKYGPLCQKESKEEKGVFDIVTTPSPWVR